MVGLVAFSTASRFVPPNIFLRKRLNPVTPWPTMLHVRVRRQTGAETKRSFPATPADIESRCSVNYHKVVHG